eukprot:ANDGO_02828.mRNA.1 putative E3 ubiquitin-protein ligase HERC2
MLNHSASFSSNASSSAASYASQAPALPFDLFPLSKGTFSPVFWSPYDTFQFEPAGHSSVPSNLITPLHNIRMLRLAYFQKMYDSPAPILESVPISALSRSIPLEPDATKSLANCCRLLRSRGEDEGNVPSWQSWCGLRRRPIAERFFRAMKSTQPFTMRAQSAHDVEMINDVMELLQRSIHRRSPAKRRLNAICGWLAFAVSTGSIAVFLKGIAELMDLPGPLAVPDREYDSDYELDVETFSSLISQVAVHLVGTCPEGKGPELDMKAVRARLETLSNEADFNGAVSLLLELFTDVLQSYAVAHEAEVTPGTFSTVSDIPPCWIDGDVKNLKALLAAMWDLLSKTTTESYIGGATSRNDHALYVVRIIKWVFSLVNFSSALTGQDNECINNVKQMLSRLLRFGVSSRIWNRRTSSESTFAYEDPSSPVPKSDDREQQTTDRKRSTSNVQSASSDVGFEVDLSLMNSASMQVEAAGAVMTGFSWFFPTTSAQTALCNHLVEYCLETPSCKAASYLLGALADRVTRDRGLAGQLLVSEGLIDRILSVCCGISFSNASKIVDMVKHLAIVAFLTKNVHAIRLLLDGTLRRSAGLFDKSHPLVTSILPFLLCSMEICCPSESFRAASQCIGYLLGWMTSVNSVRIFAVTELLVGKDRENYVYTPPLDSHFLCIEFAKENASECDFSVSSKFLRECTFCSVPDRLVTVVPSSPLTISIRGGSGKVRIIPVLYNSPEGDAAAVVASFVSSSFSRSLCIPPYKHFWFLDASVGSLNFPEVSVDDIYRSISVISPVRPDSQKQLELPVILACVRLVDPSLYDKLQACSLNFSAKEAGVLREVLRIVDQVRIWAVRLRQSGVDYEKITADLRSRCNSLRRSFSPMRSFASFNAAIDFDGTVGEFDNSGQQTWAIRVGNQSKPTGNPVTVQEDIIELQFLSPSSPFSAENVFSAPCKLKACLLAMHFLFVIRTNIQKRKELLATIQKFLVAPVVGPEEDAFYSISSLSKSTDQLQMLLVSLRLCRTTLTTCASPASAAALSHCSTEVLYSLARSVSCDSSFLQHPMVRSEWRVILVEAIRRGFSDLFLYVPYSCYSSLLAAGSMERLLFCDGLQIPLLSRIVTDTIEHSDVNLARSLFRIMLGSKTLLQNEQVRHLLAKICSWMISVPSVVNSVKIDGAWFTVFSELFESKLLDVPETVRLVSLLAKVLLVCGQTASPALSLAFSSFCWRLGEELTLLIRGSLEGGVDRPGSFLVSQALLCGLRDLTSKFVTSENLCFALQGKETDTLGLLALIGGFPSQMALGAELLDGAFVVSSVEEHQVLKVRTNGKEEKRSAPTVCGSSEKALDAATVCCLPDSVISSCMTIVLSAQNDLLRLFALRSMSALLQHPSCSKLLSTSFLEFICKSSTQYTIVDPTLPTEKISACTYTYTGRNFEPQHWFYCLTCGIRDKEGVCVYCARTCHKGHSLVYAKCSSFFCDCGAQNNKHRCCSLKHSHPRDDISEAALGRALMRCGVLEAIDRKYSAGASESSSAADSSSLADSTTTSSSDDLTSLGYASDLVSFALQNSGGDRNSAASFLARSSVSRKMAAVELSQIGFDIAICEYALQLHNDDANLAAAWLIDHPDTSVPVSAISASSGTEVAFSNLFGNEADCSWDFNPDPKAVSQSAVRTLAQHARPDLSVPIPIERSPLPVKAVVFLTNNAKAVDSSAPPVPGSSLRDALAPFFGEVGLVVATGYKRADVVFRQDGARFGIKTKYMYRFLPQVFCGGAAGKISSTIDSLLNAVIVLISRRLSWELTVHCSEVLAVFENPALVARSLSMHRKWWQYSGAGCSDVGDHKELAAFSQVFRQCSFSNTESMFLDGINVFSKYASTRFHLRIEESRHPIATSTNAKEVHIFGAASILVSFDPQCRLGSGESLVFFYDEKCSQIASKFTSSNLKAKVPYVIPASRFWYRYVCQNSQSVSWGFRFSASPLSWKISAIRQGSVPNIWIALNSLIFLNSLLEVDSPHVAALQKSEVVQPLLDNALLFVLTPKAPARKDVAQVLSSISQKLHMLPPAQRFSLDLLKRARIEIERVYRRREKDAVLDDEIFLTVVECFVRLRRFLVSDLCIRGFSSILSGDSESHKYTVAAHSRSIKTVCYSCAQQWPGPETPRYKAYAAGGCESELPSSEQFQWWKSDPLVSHNATAMQDVDLRTAAGENPHECFEHASWLDRMYHVVLILQCFDSRKSLPPLFLTEAWMETRKKVVVRETPHPYSRVDAQGAIQLPGAKSLLVSFDKRSATDAFESVRFSLQDTSHDELGSFSGEDLAYKRVVINADSFFYSFQSGGYIHDTVTCDACSMSPMLGKRYKCTCCEDFDICEKCFPRIRSQHDDTHAFLQIRRPAQLNPARIPCLYPESWKHSAAFKSDVHTGVRCDHCGTKPIRGVRYRCENCHEFNLCERCAQNPDANHDRQHSFLVVTRPLPPESQLPSNNLPYGLLYRKERDSFWGWSFTVSANLSRDEMIRLLAENREELCSLSNAMRDWPSDVDKDLVAYANEVCEQGWLNVQPHELQHNHIDALRFPRLVSVPIDRLRFRFVVLKLLNSKLAPLLPLMLLQPRLEGCPSDSLGMLVSRLRSLIFYDTKLDIWNRALSQSHSEKEVCMAYLNRHMIAQSADKPLRVRAKFSIFGQAFAQLHGAAGELMRRKDRAFKVTFVGEGSDDYGGPYRDALTQMVAELQDGTSSGLLMRTPNGISDAGDSREKFMPSPNACTPYDLEQYKFLGRLIGVALRSKNHLALDLSNHLWKSMVGLSLDRADLRSVDEFAVHFTDSLRELSGPDAEETFHSLIESSCTWVVKLADGSETALIGNGKQNVVSFQDRLMYADLYEQARIHEVDRQVEKIVEGVNDVVPGNRWLTLFGNREVEMLACGSPSVDLDMLKRHTVYEGFNAKSKVIVDFWSVLEEASSEDRSMFLRFVSGRARLPLTDSAFDRPMKIQVLDRPRPDDYLPLSHTCFFSIELPKYSNKEVLRSKLLYAIRHCTAIDTDFTQGGEISRHMEWNDVNDLETPL